MKKLCCIPCPPELPNLSLDFKCVSACCGGRTDRADMRSETKANEDEVDGKEELNNVEKEMEEMIKRGCCCCPLRKQRNQAKVKDKKSKKNE